MPSTRAAKTVATQYAIEGRIISDLARSPPSSELCWTMALYTKTDQQFHS
jgi:hypothetical protein